MSTRKDLVDERDHRRLRANVDTRQHDVVNLGEELSAHSRFFPLRSIWGREECVVVALHSPGSHPDAQAKPADIVLNAYFTRFADNSSKATRMSSPTLARIPAQMNFSAYSILLLLSDLSNVLILILFNEQKHNACSIDLVNSGLGNIL